MALGNRVVVVMLLWVGVVPMVEGLEAVGDQRTVQAVSDVRSDQENTLLDNINAHWLGRRSVLIPMFGDILDVAGHSFLSSNHKLDTNMSLMTTSDVTRYDDQDDTCYDHHDDTSDSLFPRPLTDHVKQQPAVQAEGPVDSMVNGRTNLDGLFSSKMLRRMKRRKRRRRERRMWRARQRYRNNTQMAALPNPGQAFGISTIGGSNPSDTGGIPLMPVVLDVQWAREVPPGVLSEFSAEEKHGVPWNPYWAIQRLSEKQNREKTWKEGKWKSRNRKTGKKGGKGRKKAEGKRQKGNEKEGFSTGLIIQQQASQQQ